ncbi:uncharacterized protein LOC107506372 [Rousettus aegyptiacus]|uniref:uncharacterized protein LOC107506372 n=1 Tax=Rousettus aegyptiacus TaxID=9407 RepID=UPI00168D5DE5|nr:uncharacterized protein LOC107506372 [Rousettus aegyptiacus]
MLLGEREPQTSRAPLRTRPAPEVVGDTALHRHPHFRSLLTFPLVHSSFATRPGQRTLGAAFSRPSALVSAGPSGLAERASPGFPGSPPPHHVPPGAVAASAGHEGKATPAAATSPPYVAPGTLDSDPYSQLTAKPEAGRRKPQLGRPAHRSVPVWIRPEEVEGPVSGCAIARSLGPKEKAHKEEVSVAHWLYCRPCVHSLNITELASSHSLDRSNSPKGAREARGKYS